MLSVSLCGTLLCGDDDEEQVRETLDALCRPATTCVDMHIEETHAAFDLGRQRLAWLRQSCVDEIGPEPPRILASGGRKR